jgi:hypothetical protein
MSTAMTKVGAGSTKKHRRHATHVPRNDEGLTYSEWLRAAAMSSTQKTFAAWKKGEDPTDWRAAGGAGENPMSGTMKMGLIVGGTVLALGAVTGVVYLWKMKSAQAATGSWKRSLNGLVPKGAPARVAISAAAIQSLLPVVTNAQALATNLTMLRMLTNITAWGPGETPGWSFSDDPAPQSEFHAQFVNASGMDLNMNQGIPGFPALPWTVWVHV